MNQQAVTKKNIAKVAMTSLALRAALAGLGLISSVFLARSLGIEGYGKISMILSAIGLLAIPATQGWTLLLSREVTRSLALNRPELAKGAVIFGVTGILLVAGLTGLITIAFPQITLSSSSISLSIIPAAIILTAMSAGASAILTGIDRPLSGQFSAVIERALYITFSGIVVLWLGNVDVGSILYAYIGALALSVIYLLMKAKRTLPIHMLRAKSKIEAPRLLKIWFPGFLSGGVGIANQKIQIILVGIALDPSVAGIYAVALQIRTLSEFGVTAIGTATLRPIMSLQALNNSGALQKIANVSSYAATSFSGAGIVVFYLFGKWFLSLAYGPVYVESYQAIIILLLAQLCIAITAAGKTLLSAFGNYWTVFAIECLRISTSVGLTIPLALSYGLVGAAVAQLLSAVIVSVALAIATFMKTDLIVIPFPIRGNKK